MTGVQACALPIGVWEHFGRYIVRPDLIHAEERPEHRHTDHGERAELYREAIAAFCRSKPRDALVAEMVEADVPTIDIYSPEEALEQPNVAAHCHRAADGIDWSQVGWGKCASGRGSNGSEGVSV